MRKVAVVGCRTYTDYDRLEGDLNRLRSRWGRFMVVSGGAAGADALAERYARTYTLPLCVFPANWNQNGRAAGPIRNSEIVVFCDCMVAYWDGKSRGTGNAIQQAREMGKRVWVREI